jgi:hypothetical protein
MPTVDRSLAVMIIGPIVGLAVAHGYVEPQNADALTNNLVTFIGLGITIASVLIPLNHHYKTQQPKPVEPAASAHWTPEAAVAETPAQTPAQ